MKIMIIGYSGSGKSTLAKHLGQVYHCPVLHLDSIHFTSNWQERDNKAMAQDLTSFLENHNWVIDGNYRQCLLQERLSQADQIIFLSFNRWHCLYRALKRYLTYKGQTRPDMAENCKERVNWDFIKWILKDGRNKEKIASYKNIMNQYPEKSILLKNQKEIDRFLKKSYL